LFGDPGQPRRERAVRARARRVLGRARSQAGVVEIADGGTLFLDEIGDLGQAAQAKMLTFIEQRSFRRLGATAPRRVNVRIVAATNRDLKAMVAAKTFREDLWYRLSGMMLRLPALRERPDDIAPLTDRFLAEANRVYQRRWTGWTARLWGCCAHYSWPGNVRELRAVISRAALMNDEQTLRRSTCGRDHQRGAGDAREPGGRAPGQDDATGRHPSRRSWRRSTSAACWRCARATRRWRRSTWGSRDTPWQRSSKARNDGGPPWPGIGHRWGAWSLSQGAGRRWQALGDGERVLLTRRAKTTSWRWCQRSVC
jgi:DNA-binding NtrC family response regulator